MIEILEGFVVVLGKNIDTDQIYPGRYLGLSEPAEVAEHCLEGIDPELGKLVGKGTILVASTNFGCGSSREHAPIALLHKGVPLVIADSFARIFYRNSLNLGFPLLVCKDFSDHVRTGEKIRVDLNTSQIWVGKNVFQAEALGEHVLSMLSAGGVKPLFLKKHQSIPSPEQKIKG